MRPSRVHSPTSRFRRVSDRPEFRTLYATFADDADVHALSAPAFKALIMLKLSLPVVGLGVIYPSKLSDQVGCDRAQLEVILSELEAPKPGRDHGWIVRDRNIVWIVNAFACEPGMTPANRNHVKFVRKLVAAVDSRSSVVEEFRKSYQQWFQADTKPIPKPSSSPRQHITNGSESPGDPSGHDSTRHYTTKSGDLDQERGAPPASAPPFASLGELTAAAPEIARFVHRHYPPETTPAARLADVGQQLVALLGSGVPFNGGLLRTTFARLEAKCTEVNRERIRDRDKAIVVLLTKLADSTDVTAAAVAEEQQQRASETRSTQEEILAAKAWLETRPSLGEFIARQLARDGFVGNSDDPALQSAWRIGWDAAVVRAYRARASPDPDTAKNPATP